MRLLLASLCSLFATSSLACTTHDSDSILTSGMYASLGARADGSGRTRTHATLFLGNPASLDFIDLVGDDRLIATREEQMKVMIETQILGTVSYHADFDGDQEDTAFNIALQRTVDGGAPSSSCTLPPPFEVATDEGAEMSRDSAFVIEWDLAGAGDVMSWELEGPCIRTATGSISDDSGSAIIPAGTVEKRQGEEVQDECEVTLEIRRSRDGDLDPGYGRGGVIRCEQVRQASLTSVP
jgi:hypothetical protein